MVKESYRVAMSDSALIRSQSDENRSKPAMPVRFLHMVLDDALPIRMHYPHEHDDSPIRLLHVHGCWELGYCFEGSGMFIVGSKVMSFEQGSVSLIGPDEPHLAQSLAGTYSRWAWVYFDPLALVNRLDANLRELDPSPLHGLGFANLTNTLPDDPLRVATTALIRELQANTLGRSTMIRALVCQILLLYRRAYSQVKLDSTASDSPSPRHLLERLAPAMEYMATHYHEHLDVATLAKRCNMSESHFRKRFAKTLGQSPQAYWQHLRIRMAASMLRSTDQSILHISQAVGFETLSSFNRLFKQIMSTTPSHWRREIN